LTRHPFAILAGSLGGGIEPLGLSAFTDVVPPAFASIERFHGDEVWERHCPQGAPLYPLSYGPAHGGPAGFEPASPVTVFPMEEMADRGALLVGPDCGRCSPTGIRHGNSVNFVKGSRRPGFEKTFVLYQLSYCPEGQAGIEPATPTLSM